MTKANLKQKIAEIFANDRITTKSDAVRNLITDHVTEDLSLMIECDDIQGKYINACNMLEKTRRTVKNQGNEISLLLFRQTELKDKLKRAEVTIADYQSLIGSKQKHLEDSLNTFESNYESQLKIAENEIKRLNTVVDFLKTELFKTMNGDQHDY